MTERISIRNGRDLTTNSSNKMANIQNPNVLLFPGSYKFIDPFKQSNLIRDFNELYQKIYDKEKYINL
jgi:hypothetical protein